MPNLGETASLIQLNKKVNNTDNILPGSDFDLNYNLNGFHSAVLKKAKWRLCYSNTKSKKSKFIKMHCQNHKSVKMLNSQTKFFKIF